MDVASLQVIIQTKGVDVAQRELDKLSKNAGNAEKSVGGLASSMKALGAVATVGAVVSLGKEAVKMADSYKLVEARLSLVTKGTLELANAQQSLFNISQNTRQSFKETADLYASLARSTQQLGKTQAETLRVTETINKAIIISGASAQSAQAALVQLGQGFASGTLRGEELNSVLEQTPRIAEAIAKGMGVTIGQLRALGAEGSLTGEAVFEALQKQAKAVDEEFAKIPPTVGQATIQIGNSLTLLAGTLDKATGATDALARSFSDLSKTISDTALSMDVANKSVFSLKTADEFDKKTKLITDEINELRKALETDDGFLWFGLDERTTGEYQNRIKRLEQQLKQLGDTRADVAKSLAPSLDDAMRAFQNSEKAYRSTFNPSKEEIEAEKKATRERISQAKKLAEDWSKRKIEIRTETDISEQDELAKPFLQLQLEYQKDLEEFKGVMGAKELLAENFNKKYQRLGLDATAKIEEEAQKAKTKDIQKELKLQEENFRIQARQIDLLDDEADRQVALATLERQRTQASLKAQMELGEVTPQHYNAMMEMEDKLLEKQKQNWTLAGQIVNNVTSQMESSMTDFLDATSDNFADFGKMATSILQEVYREIIRISVVKPLVGSLTSGAMSLFSGGVTANAQGGAYSSPSLSQYSNQIVDKPTFFAFASGGAPNMGVMGEAGSEAILPLSRTSNGDLGVKADGMGLNQVKIQIINESGTQMEVTKTSQTSDVEGMVIQAWISGISKNRYGSRDMLGGR